MKSATHTTLGWLGMTLRYRFGKTGESCLLSVVRTKRLRGLMPKPWAPHHTRDTLVIDHMPTSAQFVRHAPVAIARQLILNVLNQFDEAPIVEALPGRRRPIVEGTARQFDHLAPSSDGAGFGPETIDKFSLSLTRRGRGVFLTRSSSIVSWPTLRSSAAIFEPGKRLYIRKATLRQWREQFAALMREQGVAANATPRQVRGQIRQPLKSAIHHRLRALRAFGQLPPDERAGGRPPRTSSFMQAKLGAVLRALQTKRDTLDAGKDEMLRTRQEVAADWQATADTLRRQGQAELAERVERFIERMPAVQTDGQRMAERWKDAERNRAQERTGAKSPGAPAR